MATELDIARSNLGHAGRKIARLDREVAKLKAALEAEYGNCEEREIANAALRHRAEEAEDRFAIGKRDIAESSELARTLAKENAALKSERDEGLAREALHRQAILDSAKTVTALRRAAGDFRHGDQLARNGRELLAMDEALNRIAEAASEWPNALAGEFGSPVEFAEAVAGKIARLRTALACEQSESTARMQGVERERDAIKAAAPRWEEERIELWEASVRGEVAIVRSHFEPRTDGDSAIYRLVCPIPPLPEQDTP